MYVISLQRYQLYYCITTHPLLILSALNHSWVLRNRANGLPVPLPEVQPHLQVAEDHPHHGQQVGHQEEYQVVAENKQF